MGEHPLQDSYCSHHLSRFDKLIQTLQKHFYPKLILPTFLLSYSKRIAFIAVEDCREKWRNIRSAFVRSMKASRTGSKAKKPYYMKDDLQFIMPYIKPHRLDLGNMRQPETQITEISTNSESSEESQDYVQNTEAEKKSTSVLTTAKPRKKQSQLFRRRLRKCRRPLPEFEQVYLKDKSTRSQAAEETTVPIPNMLADPNPMGYFFMSLLPEFESMTEDQIRSFKIKVMILIDDIKSNKSECTPSSSYFAMSTSGERPRPANAAPYDDSPSFSGASQSPNQFETPTFETERIQKIEKCYI